MTDFIDGIALDTKWTKANASFRETAKDITIEERSNGANTYFGIGRLKDSQYCLVQNRIGSSPKLNRFDNREASWQD